MKLKTALSEFRNWIKGVSLGHLKTESNIDEDLHVGYGIEQICYADDIPHIPNSFLYLSGHFRRKPYSRYLYVKAVFADGEILLSPNEITSLLSQRPYEEVHQNLRNWLYICRPSIEGFVQNPDYVRRIPVSYVIKRHKDKKLELVPKYR